MLHLRAILVLTILFQIIYKHKVLSQFYELKGERHRNDDNKQQCFSPKVVFIDDPPQRITDFYTTLMDSDEMCSNQGYKDCFRNITKKLTCQPEEQVINLQSRSNANVYPSNAVVKTCRGICSHGKKCSYVKREPIVFYVRSNTRCTKVTLMNDVECNCKCPNENMKCKENQTYSKKICRCLCKNKKERTRCLQKWQNNTFWDEEKCACLCKETRSCTTGTVWLKDQCRCSKPAEHIEYLD